MLNSDSFNNEELYYLNRIAFRLFKKHGGKVRFEKFHSDLNTLQNGDFDLRLKLWLKLIVEHEEEISQQKDDINLKVNSVSKQKFGNVVRASYPQDLSGSARVNEVVDCIFERKEWFTLDELPQKIESSP